MSVLRSWALRLNVYLPAFMRFPVAEDEKEEIVAPIVRPTPQTSTTIIKKLRGAAWDGSAMFFGTLAWMGVYYAKDKFAELDDDGAGSYILHSLLMGIVANLAVLPLVRQNHISNGETPAQAISEIKKYFILCTIPDALYEPTADWLAAMARADSFTHFDFVKYADPTFNVKEAAGAFVFFGVVFGMIYYAGGKFIQHYWPDEEEIPDPALGADASAAHRALRNFRHIIDSDEFETVMAGLQYFLFYLTDDLFEIDWESVEVTIPRLLIVCGLMAAYTFLVDALKISAKALEYKLYLDDAKDNQSLDKILGIYENDLEQPLMARDGSVSPYAANGKNLWNDKNHRLLVAPSEYGEVDEEKALLRKG
jgi:hypothetical protein